MNYMYPRNKLVSIRVNEDLLKQFNELQESEYGWRKKNLADLVEMALKDFIEKENKKSKK